MKEVHYKKKLSAFLNRELAADEHREIGEHLLNCPECRCEHDGIKLGASFAQTMTRHDAPEQLWRKLDAELDRHGNLNPDWRSVFRAINWRLATALLLCAFGLAAVVFLFVSGSAPAEYTENPESDSGNAGSESISLWQVENISGKSRITNSTTDKALNVGATLETDSSTRAKIEVADIGRVEVAPNSLVKLVNSSKSEHRLSLERGTLTAQILAPPRLFVVDTPSAAAVDLGCAYKLEVDDEGNSRLHVTSGYVSLERDGLESIVPAGAFCYTRKGVGIGTPFFETATKSLKKALESFDFAGEGEKALARILSEAKAKDSLTLWHLLRRVSGINREKVIDRLISFEKLPEGVTRAGVLRLDKNMLDKLKSDLELGWY